MYSFWPVFLVEVTERRDGVIKALDGDLAVIPYEPDTFKSLTPSFNHIGTTASSKWKIKRRRNNQAKWQTEKPVDDEAQ